MPPSPLAPERFPELPVIPGVRLNATAAGIRTVGRNDLMLAELAPGSTIAGVVTRSLTASAPVLWCKAALAGGPVRGGRVVGESDALGAFPKSNPKTPQDVLATIYHHLGVDPEAQYLNNAGRPISVLPSGAPINELFS